MAYYYLTIERASNQAFTTDVLSGTFAVSGALPARIILGDVEEKWGRRRFNRTEWMRRILVEFIPTSVVASALDYGDYALLEEILVSEKSKYVRLKRTGTVLPRTMTTAGTDHNFWTDATRGLLASDYEVVVMNLDLTPNRTAGTDKAIATFEGIKPNV